MSPEAKELLLKFVSSYQKDDRNNFNFLFYREYSNSVINELISMGCIIKEKDYCGTIRLTYDGYDIAMESLK